MRILFHGQPTQNTERAINALEKSGCKVARISESVIDDNGSLFSRDGTMDPLILSATSKTCDILKTIRKMQANCPLLVIHEDDADISGILDSGADDVLKPPYNGQEIISRIGSISRRISRMPTGMVTVGDLMVGIDGRKVTVSGMPVKISSIERRILSMLASNYPNVTAKTSIYETLYGLHDNPPQEKVIDAHIHNLRKKITSHDSLGRNFIRTVVGVGYEFAA